jgi:UbiD family decarboxylase
MHVKAINYRQGAYYQDITPGRAKEHLRLVSVPRESSAFKFIQQSVPTVKDVCMPMSGSGAYTCYISLRKTAEGQGKNAIFAALAHDHFIKLAVVVDDDINVYNEEEVMWAVATRMQADKDVFIIKNVMGCMLDHTSNNGLTAKMGIDATRNLDNLTPICQVSRKALNSVKEKIDRLNL